MLPNPEPGINLDCMEPDAGPWIVQEQASDDYEPGGLYIEANEAGRDICDIKAEITAEEYANARLIAAAPDLLEALKTAYVLIEADIIRDDAGCLDKIRNAIAKAEGREE